MAKKGSKEILIVGSVNADIYIELDRLPAPGETLGASDDSGYVLPGGKGANQAAAVARLVDPKLGFKVKFAGNFGKDSHATMLKGVLEKEKVDISLCSTVDKPTGQAYILLQKGGENSIVIVGGANMNWNGVTPALKKSIESAAVVMLQREIPTPINIQVAKIAHDAGVPVVLDLGGRDEPLPEEIIPHLYMLAPNETELSRITGLPTDNLDQVKVACAALQKKGVKYVLVTLGAKGALVVAPGGAVTFQSAVPPKGGKIIDTTGAGDTFRAAFCAGLAEGKPLQESLLLASGASSICISKKGAMPSIPSRADTVSYISSLKAKL